jgi:hypothetical protein
MLGIPLLALLIPVAWATLEPQSDQCRWSTTHAPSANKPICEGRITLGSDGCPGALIVRAVLGQK